MSRKPTARAAAGAALVLLAAACTDRQVLPTAAGPTLPTNTVGKLTCSVDVKAQTLACAPAALTGPRADRIIGGQDVYVKLASSGTAWDAGTEILSSNVTVQSLVSRAMGTPDGSTVSGVSVFFDTGPTVTSGTGMVTVANATGTGTFLSTNQPYFLYNEILAPFQISQALTWMFNVPSTVATFTFTVYVSAALPNENDPLADKVWTGAVDSLWSNASNWQGGVVPDSASVVAVPPDSLLASHRAPKLTADADVAYLRVGYGLTMDLAGFTMRVRGTADAVGAIANGTLWESGSGALLGGNFDAMQVTGSAALQRSVKTTGAVSVTGSLSVKDHAMSIQLP